MAAKYVLLKNKETGERSVRITGGEVVSEKENPAEYARLRKLAIRNLRQNEVNEAYRSCGLTRVRSQSGKVYWE